MKRLLLFFFSFFLCFNVFSQADSLLQWKFTSKKIKDNIYQVTAAVKIPTGWYLYGNNDDVDSSISLTLNFDYENAKTFGLVRLNKPATIFTDATFDNKKINIYKDSLKIDELVKITGFIPAKLKGTVNAFIGQKNNFLSANRSFEVPLEGGANATAGPQQIKLATVDINHPLANCGGKNDVASKGYLSIFFLGFLGGLIALLTPCVFPMIPVTVSFFTKRSANRKHAIRNGALYGFFIFLIYVLASVPFHIIGNVQPEIFNNIATNTWLNIIFFAIFIFFSISFFGFFDITLPSSIAGKADAKSGLTSIGGIFFMALTLAIVSFSCTGPILGSLLVGSISGGAWQLTSGLAGFGLALALPFALFAIFPSLLKSLPKSGGWLDTVKKVLAFVELGLAFKFFSNADLVMHWGILKREVFIGIWIIISFALTLYLFGIIRLPHDHKGMKITAGRKFVGVIALLFTIYLIPGVTNTTFSFYFIPGGTNNRHSDLQLLSGFPPPLSYSIYKISSGALEADVVNDYAKALQLSQTEGKPLLIDFTGWACVNCRRMEENVWSDPRVYTCIKQNFILVSLYVDDRKRLPVQQRFTYITSAGVSKDIINEGDEWATFESENFGQQTQPLYVILDNKERLINNPVGYTPDVDAYLKWLQCGQSNFVAAK